MNSIYPDHITEQYLDDNPNIIFVFGDNLERRGSGGAARLRNHRNIYGFITKKAPTWNLNDYYTPEDYKERFFLECDKLKKEAKKNKDKTYLVSKVGAGLANKFKIWEKIIEPKMKDFFADATNVVFLW